MNEKPKVSVIMPSLNVASFIRQCMESVLNQTLKDIEIICIDACSDDGTLEILQEYAGKDNRILLLCSDKRSYGYQVNLGFDSATADYIGIVETDDYIVPEMFEELYAAASRAGFPDVVKAGYYSVRPEEDGSLSVTPVHRINLETGSIFRLQEHYEMITGHPSIWSGIYKREFLIKNNIRMLEVSGGGWVDNPFLFRTMCEAKQICWVNKPLYYYRRSNPKATQANQNASSILKDCSVPIARINDIKDYLDLNYPNDKNLEQYLFARMSGYLNLIYNSPFCTAANRRAIADTKKRFRNTTKLRVILNRYFRKIKSAIYNNNKTK